MLNIAITSSMLCDLLQGQMSYCACDALVDWLEEAQEADRDFVPTIGDIAISYTEIPAENVEEGDCVIAELNNGNALIAH